MSLPKHDLAFLQEDGFTWRFEPQGPSGGFLIIDNFNVSGGGFSPPLTSLLIQIPPLYNQTPLDMWYCDPPVRKNGAFPVQADQMVPLLGRTWQRFSRHFPPGVWRPGKDGLRALFVFINQELRGK